jgi:hypothetical protein
LTLVTLVLIIGFSLAGRTKFLGDADTFWHIAVGRLTLDSGLVHHDPFSFTRHGESWIANQWLAECIMAMADRLGGFDGIFVLTVGILAATYMVLSYRWIVRGFDPLLTLAIMSLIISASAYTLNARPHIVSIGLLGLVFWLLRDIEDGRRPLTQLPWLIPVFIVWSNLHGAVLGGLGTLALVAGAWTGLRLVHAAGPLSNSRDIGLLWLSVAGCGLALLATPYGTGSLQAWWTIMSMSLPELIIEHAPLRTGSIEGFLVIVLGIVYVAIFAATPRAWARPTYWLPLVWLALTCLRIRHAPLFAIVAGIALADLLPLSRLALWLNRRGWLRALSSAPTRTNVLLALSVLLIMIVPLAAATVWLKHIGPLPLIGAGWARPTPRVWPAELLGPLKSYAAEQPDGTPIFNEPILGGFLIDQCPELRVFIDGRCELYGEGFLRDFVAAWDHPARVDNWQKQFSFRAALVEADSPLRQYFDKSGRWRIVAQSPAAVFYRMN